MKIRAPLRLSLIGVALAGPSAPLAASAQLGFNPLPDVEYRSARRCLRALDKIQKQQEAISVSATHKVERKGEFLNVTDQTAVGYRWRAFRCWGSTLMESWGGVDGQTPPPPPTGGTA